MKLFYATGYNSWTNKQIHRVLDSLEEAQAFTRGLTDSRILRLVGRTKTECLNKILSGMEPLK